jgi:3-dehydroquinate synthase
VRRSNGSGTAIVARLRFPAPHTQPPTPCFSCATVSCLKMTTIRVRSSNGSYEVVCARGALAQSVARIARLGDVTGIFILSSPRVWEHWGSAVTRALRPAKKNRVILFEDAETEKDLPSVEAICRALIRAGADRHSVIVAVGGGVVGDVAGFAAAMYLRGVRLIQIPTTLVAQVDSSLGGKAGVNLPEGKNLVGAFHPPQLVITDPELLSTLPHREYRSGLFEVVKYGVIADEKLFEFLEKRMDAIERRDPDALSWIIPRCIAIKARVVSEDEREGGPRQILNFGHTLGHALEAATGYKRFAHGEAIGWGMIAATLMGLATGRVNESDASRIIRLVASVGPLPSLKGIRASQLRTIVAGDKKAHGGRVRWVLPRRIGKTEWGVEVPWKVVAQVFAELPAIAEKARA